MILKKTSRIKGVNLDGYLFFNSNIAWTGLPGLQAGIMANNFTGAGAVPLDDLYRLCQKIGKDEIITINGAPDGVKVGTTKGIFSFGPVDENDIFECAYMESTPVLQISNFTDIDILKKAKAFVSKDEMRQAMMGIYFDGRDIVATDARRMFYRSVKYDFMVPDAKGISDHYGTDKAYLLIDPIVVDIFSDKKSFSIFTGAGRVHYVGDGRFFSHNIIDANYPNYRAVIPTDQANYFTVRSSEMLEKIELAMLSASSATNQIVLHVNGAVNIESKDLDYSKSYKGRIDINTINSDEMSIGFNGKFLIDIVKQIPDNIEIRYSAPNRAVILNDSYLIMPVMLNN